MSHAKHTRGEREGVVREFWTLAEVAKRLGVHTFTARRLCWSGKLLATRIGSALRISETELQRYIQQNTDAPTPDSPTISAGASMPQ